MTFAPWPLDGTAIIRTFAAVMSAAHQPSSPTGFYRRLVVAVGGAALILALSIFSASPVLHDCLHEGATPEEDTCAVVLFAEGLTLPAGLLPVAPRALELAKSAPVVAREIFLIPPRYLRQPERGPPALG